MFISVYCTNLYFTRYYLQRQLPGGLPGAGDLWEADLHCQGAVDEQEVRALLGGAGQHYTSLTCPGE